MTRRLFTALAVILGTVFLGANPTADSSQGEGSQAEYPKDWRSWVKVKETYIPSADTPLPAKLPPLFVDTIKTYNWINGGKGTRLDIYVNPKAMAAYKTHGPYDDGITVVGVFTDAKIAFVTQHVLGEAMYGTYNFDGEDISKSHATLNTAHCVRCHVGYSDICVNGTCAVPDNAVVGRSKK